MKYHGIIPGKLLLIIAIIPFFVISCPNSFKFTGSGGSSASSKTSGAFAGRRDYLVGKSPQAVVAKDFNGDGKPDLAVANDGGGANDGNVSVLLNKGDGTFQPAQNTNVTAGRNERAVVQPLWLATGDFNKDGKADLVTANIEGFGAGSFSILLNNGDGTFKFDRKQSIADSRVFGVAAGDIDQDSDDDLAITKIDKNEVQIWRNDGGAFTLLQTKATGKEPQGVALGKLNSDNFPDLAVANRNADANPDKSYISIYENTGGTGFGAEIQSKTGGGNASYIRIGELDGVNGLDIATANSNNDTISVFKNQGARALAVAHGSATSLPNASSTSDLTLANLDGKDQSDVVVGNSQVNRVLLNNGSGNLGSPTDFDTADRPTGMTTADVNGDGHADVISANETNDTVSVSLGDGAGKLVGVSKQSVGATVKDTASADLDGNGQPDIITANDDSAKGISILFNTGNGFESAVNYDTGRAHSKVTTLDANGDGKTDLLAITSGDTTMTLLTNKGDKTFTLKNDFSTGAPPVAVKSADLDGDGVPEIITVSNDPAKNVSILQKDSAGKYNLQQNIDTAGSKSTSLASGDVNGDGKPDLVVTDQDSDAAVLVNQGGLKFSEEPVADSKGANDVVIGDLDGDGKEDDFGMGFTSSDTGTAYFSSPTTGRALSFTKKTLGTVGDKPVSVVAKDLNNDDKVDLVFGNETSNNTSVLINKGDGTFEAAAFYGAGPQVNGVTVADFNGDKKPDLVAGIGKSGTSEVNVLNQQ